MSAVKARGFVLAAGLAVGLWLGYPSMLDAAGRALVHVDEPGPADVIVVLAGDWSGERILRAAELAKARNARRVVASGATLHFGIPECRLAIDLAAKNGYDRELFQCFEQDAHSTREEASKMIPALRAQGVRRIILVTNDAHTGRARYIWKKLAPEFDIRVAASNTVFQSGRWWHDREGWKEFHNEVLKYATSLFDL